MPCRHGLEFDSHVEPVFPEVVDQFGRRLVGSLPGFFHYEVDEGFKRLVFESLELDDFLELFVERFRVLLVVVGKFRFGGEFSDFLTVDEEVSGEFCFHGLHSDTEILVEGGEPAAHLRVV